MKTKGKIMKLGIFLGSIFLICALLIGVIHPGISSQEKASGIFSLIEPALAQEMDASFLKEEAGIAAYINTERTIDLTKAKMAFKAIERETESHIIGSVALPDYPTSENVHCYVHKDGWIVAYYLKGEPTSKIIDWNRYSREKLTKTKLEEGLDEICTALGVIAPNIKYSHFQYPNANKCKIIVKSLQAHGKGGDVTASFRLNIPSDLTIYERSWSLYAYGDWSEAWWSPHIEVDNEKIDTVPYSGMTEYGQLTAAQLSSRVFHTIEIAIYKGTADGGIVLVYRELPTEVSSRIITEYADSVFTFDLKPFPSLAQQAPTLTPTPTPPPTIAPVVPPVTSTPTPTPTPAPFASIPPFYIIGAAAVIAIILIAGIGISRKRERENLKEFLYLTQSTKPKPDTEPAKQKEIIRKETPPLISEPLTIERAIYDPCKRDFIERALPRMKEWINRYDPGAYWFAISIQNNTDRAIEEWGVVLETSSALKVEKAIIEGMEYKIGLRETHPEPYKNVYAIGVPKEYGVVIPKGGAQRVYFKLHTEKPKTTYEINGIFKSDFTGNVPIRAKEFKYLCDASVSPEAVKVELKKTFSEKEAARLALSFKTVQELDRMRDQDTKTEEYLDKLSVLKNYTEGFSDKFSTHMEEFSRFMEQEQSGYLDDEYKGKVRRFCTNLVDVWISEFLKG